MARATAERGHMGSGAGPSHLTKRNGFVGQTSFRNERGALLGGALSRLPVTWYAYGAPAAVAVSAAATSVLQADQVIGA